MIATARALRHAVRRLRRAPAFTAAAVLTLALGIGATTAVFSVVDGVLLRPLPYDQPGQLVDLSHTLVVSGLARVDQSDATYLFYRRANHVFSDMGAYRAVAVNVGRARGAGADESERVAAAFLSASLLPVLRAHPVRGRALAPADDQPGAPPVVLIGERLWERAYGADPAILGRRLEIDGVMREVVGVMPADFRFPDADTELWLPLALDPAHTESANFIYQAVARLRDGVSVDAARADLQRLLPRVPEAFPGRLTAKAIEQTQMRAVVRPLRDRVVGDIARVLWVVLGTMGFVLLIACANVGNLFLVRAEGRQKEMAVRRALGAGRGAVLAEFLAEGVVLTVLGGALGLVLADAGIQVIQSLSGGVHIPRIAEVRIDGVVLAFTATVTALAALFFGALPAMRSGSAALSTMLTSSGGSATVGRARHRTRHALVVSQVALALVLLVGSGLMARSFARLRAVEPGFESSGVLTFRVALPSAAYAGSADAARFYVHALDELAALPGVQAAGVVSRLPLDDEGHLESAVFVEDRPTPRGELPHIHPVARVTSGYFRALGIPLIAGRLFEQPDPVRSPRDVVVSRALAERYWQGESAIGKRVRLDVRGPWSTVVGVVGNVRGASLEQPPEEMVYVPLAIASPGISVAGDTAWAPHDMAFVVRTAGRVQQIATAARRAVRTLDPALPLYHLQPMTGLVSRDSARTSFTLLLLGLASVVALLLGAVGIYGVIAYMVSLRTREIGVRLALGAQPADVRRMVSRQGVTVAALGVAVGLLGALALTRFLGALLIGVSPTDPVTLGGAAAVLLGVAMVASWIPARRAAGVDPAEALRAE